MRKSKKREPDIVILSDIHLGTYGCHAEELLRYLKTIKPKKLILNGDIMWQFSKALNHNNPGGIYSSSNSSSTSASSS